TANLRQQHTRLLLLLLVGLTTIALFLLASSLNNLEIGPGEHFYVTTQQDEQQEIIDGFTWRVESFLRIMAYIAAALFLLSFLVVMRAKDNRKKAIKLIGRNLMILAGFMLLITFFSIFYNPEEPIEEEDTTPAMDLPLIQPITGNDDQEPASPINYSPPTQPSVLIFIITLIIILGTGALGYNFWKQTHLPKTQLNEIARKALDELSVSDGRDWQDIVIRCYADMSSVVRQRMDLHRNKSMTPAEFSSRLISAGLPANPVYNLTRLFEKARYSDQQSSAVDIREAMTCLSAIMQVVERGT
ncbi:MAG: DUF4129 domain-containing protein, partial [Anaerolineales bacterium]